MKLFEISAAGVDLGSRTLKGIQLKKKNGRVRVDRYFYVDLQKQGEQPTIDLQSTLRASVEINKMKNIRVAAALKDDAVYIFDLELPEMPEKDLKAAVEFEVSAQMEKTEEELVIDYYVFGEQGEGEEKRLKIRAFCGEKAQIGALMKTLSSAGMRPYSIESEMLAAIEALRFNEYITDSSCCCVISLGNTSTNVSFVIDGQLVKSRVEKVSFGQINEMLQARLGLDFAQSEAAKLNYHFNDSPDSTTPEQEVIEEVVFQISKLIKNELESFHESHPGIHIEKVYLIGGGSRFSNIDTVFQSFFGIQTEVANPFKNIDIYSGKENSSDIPIGEISAHMTTAVGLALRSVS